MRKIIIMLFVILNIFFCKAQNDSSDYLGQTLPGSTPVIFAPGIVSVAGRYEYGLSVSPDGNEIYYTADSPGDGLTVVKRDDRKWSSPVTANLRGNSSWEYEAFLTPDGKKLYFTSDTNSVSKFWYAIKDTSGWGKAQYLVSPVNNSVVMWCTFTSYETMYYGNNDNLKIHRVKLEDGKYTAIENLGFNGFHPSVAPDESYFIFNSSNYGGYGNSDIFIVFRKEDNSWTNPVNLGNKINTGYPETCASLSPDGKYIFFSRYNEPGSKSNIYWARADSLIDSLKTASGITKIVNLKQEQEFTVFPNPAIDIVKVLASNEIVMPIQYEMIDINGKILCQGNLNSNNELDISKFFSGIYFLRLTTNHTAIQKLVIE
jgi:Tol biopolymer transport system component